MNRTINQLIVHAGIFHADDIFCAAAVKILNPEAEILRTFSSDRDLTDIDAGIVMADIGGGCYDHHQADAPLREDGIKHCAATRLWLDYGRSVIAKIDENLDEEGMIRVRDSIYDGMLKTIAMVDNGVENPEAKGYTICSVMDTFVPAWDSEESVDQAFFKAVDCMEMILRKELERKISAEKAVDFVQKAIDRRDNGIVILDRFVPWERPVVACEDAKIVIYPSNRGGFNLQLVPIEVKSFSTRLQMPQSWRGKRGDEAEQMVPGMTFCHAGGFLCAFRTKEDAVRAAKQLVKKQGE